jgi:hypothetical protein
LVGHSFVHDRAQMQFLYFICMHLIVQTVGRATRAECSSTSNEASVMVALMCLSFFFLKTLFVQDVVLCSLWRHHFGNSHVFSA